MPTFETNISDFNQVTQEFLKSGYLIPVAAAPREFGLNPADSRAAGKTCVVTRIKLFTGGIPGTGTTTIYVETYPTPGPTSIPLTEGEAYPAYFDNFLLDPNVIEPAIAVARYGNQIGGTAGVRYTLSQVTLAQDSEIEVPITPLAFTFDPAREFNWLMRFEVTAGGANNTFMELRWSEY